ncbi:methylmalonyl-CoA mutase subunit beta [Bacillus sp. FJAT-29814]|uniref:methylmalonyl-CoA mutase subunit beta n=1 Tax=Bacillus sp. FJAT-29814 TaxID=1729688 RepID=UPI000837919A|nr:methylmalonyl-CoA mutase subunit beta [Bacillus sp. FJAT-29814]
METIKNQTFAANSLDDWKAKAEESLRGRKVETLQNATYENIILKPLYTSHDEQPVPDYSGGSDFRRGTSPLGYITRDWKVAQRLTAQSPEQLKQKLHHAVEKGQTAISVEVSKDIAENFSDIVGELVTQYPFAINAKWEKAKLLNQLKNDATGYIANDPISLFAKEGAIESEYLHNWCEEVLQAAEKFPNLRTVLVDTSPYHNGGANAVQELAISAAAGVFYIQQLTEVGMPIDQALSKMVFQFSIGSNFFMELAKLRAARIVWNKITELFGAETNARKMHMAAETSYFTKTIHDHHVNLLRSANEAFAAVLGGVHYLHVVPFDKLTGANDFSERIARNIQLILKEEAHLKKVVDPAGGSWYIEALTTELAEKAWEFFQQIDANGGLLEALKTNWLQQQIAVIYEKRNLDIQTRKQSIIGTNVYAKLDELVPQYKQETNIERQFMAVQQRRLAEPYEELRQQARQFTEKTGSVPSVAMLCLGELKQHKPRLDFMKGFLAAGGIHTIESKPIFTLEDAQQYFASLKTNYVCFCGTNEQYEQMGHEILKALKLEFPSLNVLLAGLPEKVQQAQWEEEGINQFIHVKSNCYEALRNILSVMEVTVNEA